MRRVALAGGLAGVAILVLGLAVLLPRLSANETARAPSIGGPFTLEDASGTAVTDRAYRGKWMLVYFGYTHCPDVCPTTLSDIASALDTLGAAGRRDVVPIFISVDPERDTPKIAGEYARAFGPEMVGLSGTRPQVDEAEHVYRVYAAKHPEKEGDYSMDHSSIVYVMNPSGQFVTFFGANVTPAEMAAKLRGLGV